MAPDAREVMSGGSLDKLENRVRSAVQEARTVRAENARLQACLKELTAERAVWKQQAGSNGSPCERTGAAPNPVVLRERLCAILKRLDQIDRHLEVLEGQ